jgi:Phosphate transport (Pho88)
MAGMKNLVLMGTTMMAVRRIDQDDPAVLMYARLGFAAYIVIVLLINFVLHMRVVAANNKSLIAVPPPPAPPSFAAPTAPALAAQPAEDNVTTVLAYDLGVLASARKSWMLNVVILTAIHIKMSGVSTLIMSSVMGLARFLDDPLFRLHVLGHPAVGPLKRPFKPEENPLAAMLQNLAPKRPADVDVGEDDDSEDGDDGAAPTRTTARVKAPRSRPAVAEPAVVEELADDDDDDDDDDDAEQVIEEVDTADDDDFADDEPKKSK